MLIKFKIAPNANEGYVTFTRDRANEPRFYGTKGAAGEKRLFSYICRYMNKLGFDLTSVNTQKEGHMLGDDFQPIARPIKRQDKRSKYAPNIAFYSGFYALHGANEDWNKGEVTLILVMDYFEKRPNAFEALSKLVNGLKCVGYSTVTIES